VSVRRFIGLAACACAIASGCAREIKDKGAIVATVCKITESAPDFDGRLVQIQASIESDGTHYTQLVDRSCDTKALSVIWASAGTNPRVENRLSELFTKARHPGTLDKNVNGVFEGIVRCDRRAPISCAVELTEVIELRIEPRSDSPFESK
jgi:hypothetical protein